MNNCEKLKQSYQEIKSLKQEFDLALEQASQTKDFTKVKELRKELEEKRDALKKDLSELITPEIIEKSIERIKKEKELDVEFGVDSEKWVYFDAEEKIDQVVEIITYPRNKVSTLSLWDNRIGPAGATAIAEALENENCQLSILTLMGNNLGQAGAEAIAKALKSKDCRLSSLGLRANKLGPVGATAIAKALENENCQLNSLDLGHNKLGPAGATAIAKALENENCQLSNLDLRDNNLDQAEERAIEKLIKKHRPDIELFI